jgi:hypothetical protein
MSLGWSLPFRVFRPKFITHFSSLGNSYPPLPMCILYRLSQKDVYRRLIFRIKMCIYIFLGYLYMICIVCFVVKSLCFR